MSAYHKMFKLPDTFLTLSTEVSEPFLIPNVSPISSPNLVPAEQVKEQENILAGRDRSVSIIELN